MQSEALHRGQLSIEDRAVSFICAHPPEQLNQLHRYDALLICLHQTPSCAESYRSVILELMSRAPSICVVAIDTCGFGESEPLSTDQPSISDLALPIQAVIHQWMETLNVSQVHLCGHHTGASVALELGLRLVGLSSLTFIGLPLLPSAELASYRDKMPALHLNIQHEREELAALVSVSVSEGSLQSSPQLEAVRVELRGKDPEASPAVIERELISRLLSGQRYPQAYDAVFAYDHVEALRHIQAPILLIAPHLDALSQHLAYQRQLMRAQGLDVSCLETRGGGYALDSATREIASGLSNWVCEHSGSHSLSAPDLPPY